MIIIDTIQLVSLIVYLLKLYLATVILTLFNFFTLIPIVFVVLQERNIWYWYPSAANFVAFYLLALYCTLKLMLHIEERSVLRKKTTIYETQKANTFTTF